VTHGLLDGAGLVACACTLSGAAPLSPSRWSLAERARAASGAGYAGLGVAWQEYAAWKAAGATDRDMVAALSDHGARVIELEFLHGWASDNEEARRGARDREDVVWAMADVFGARHVNAGDFGAAPPPASHDDLIERLGALCDRADRHGLLVGYECIPGTLVGDLPSAAALVTATGRRNAGVVVDAVHLYRGAPDGWGHALRSVPAARVVAVQLADGDAAQIGALAARAATAGLPPTPLARLLPGEGAFDLTAFLCTLDEMGVGAPVGVELINPEWRERPVDAVARASYGAAMAVVQRARGCRGAARP
jgi:sugar phosphate isomerase/epimerase